MKRRITAWALAVIMLATLLAPSASAAADGSGVCVVTGTGVSLTLNHYVEYTYCGKTYSSDATGAATNYAAWQKMSEADKRKVTKWFAGFNSQMDAQYGTGASAMRQFALDKSGWTQAGEVLRDRLAAKYYPELKAFYGDENDLSGPGIYLLTDEARAQLTAKELERYDEAANAYGVTYQTGVEAYVKLLNLKQKQTNAAVTAISSELIDLIMDNAVPSRPGGSLDDLKDAVLDFVDEGLGISDRIKEITGVSKLTGEDQRIDADEAAKVIALFWELMGAQEKLATVCMNRCKSYAVQLERLGADCASAAQRHKDEIAAEEEMRQADYIAAVNANALGPHISPVISVDRSQYDNDEEYNAARLTAAQSWATAEFNEVVKSFDQKWNGDYDPVQNPKSPGDPAYNNFVVWGAPFQSETDFYTGQFSDYLAHVDPDGSIASIDPRMSGPFIENPENLFRYENDYEKVFELVDRGYANVIAAYEKIESDIVAYIAAKDQIAVDFRTAVQPDRVRAWGLTYSHCGWEEDGYGDWGVAVSRWDSLQESFAQRCDKLRVSDETYLLLTTVRQKKEEAEAYRADYQRMIDEFEVGLPALYQVYAYSQDELDYSLWLAMDSIRKLEALQSSYPSWLKTAKTGASPIVGGVVAARDGITNEELYTTVLAGMSVKEREAYLRDVLKPQLEEYQKQESELLSDLRRALEMFKLAAARRNADNGALAGKPAELYNLNRESLGGMTIKNHVDMMREFGFYDYYYGLNGKKLPTATAAIPVLIADFAGESPYMTGIRTLHEELLNNRGELMRRAAAGTLRTTNYSGSITYDDHYWKNGQDSNYTIGIYGDACFRSYSSWNVWNYWYENIQPILLQLDEILYHNVSYTPVTGLNKGGATARVNSPNTVSCASIFASSGAEDVLLNVGEQNTLRVSVEPSNATLPDVYWNSSDESIAVVDQNGVVTALLPGTATITATAVDSPAGSPISVDFTVQVSSDGHDSLADYGDGFFLLAPSVEVEGNHLSVHARLGCNGGFASGNAVLVAYENGRFLGCAIADCTVYTGEFYELEAEISLSAALAGVPEVKLFLLERDSFAPATGFVPLTVSD